MLRSLTLAFSLSTFLLLATGSKAADQPRVIVADHLMPEDLEINKYVFAGTAPVGSFVVFQCDEFLDTRLIRRLQEIVDTKSRAEPYRATVLLFNPGSPGVPRGYLLKGLGGRALPVPAMNTMRGITKPGELTFEFKDDPDQKVIRRFVYSIFVEDAKSVRARVPELPPKKAHGWTYRTGDLARKEN